MAALPTTKVSAAPQPRSPPQFSGTQPSPPPTPRPTETAGAAQLITAVSLRTSNPNRRKLRVSHCLPGLVAEGAGEEDALHTVAPSAGITPPHLPLTSAEVLARERAGFFMLRVTTNDRHI